MNMPAIRMNTLKHWSHWMVLAALLLSGTGRAFADAETPGGEALVAKLTALRPDIPIERVSPSPLPGIYQLELTGGTVFYGTEDGRYLFAGDLYELADDDLINLAEQGGSRSVRH
jgi:thiol:disulfide interchange protein DsbC